MGQHLEHISVIQGATVYSIKMLLQPTKFLRLLQEELPDTQAMKTKRLKFAYITIFIFITDGDATL